MAEEVFGHTDVTGKKLTVKDAGIITITAVIEDPPLNSHFQYKSLMSLSTVKKWIIFFQMPLFRVQHGKHLKTHWEALSYGHT
jgi:hypothetical protein